MIPFVLPAQTDQELHKRVDSLMQLPASDTDSILIERWYQIGKTYLALSAKDSSGFYTEKALKLSQQHEANLQQANIFLLLGKIELISYGPRDKATRYFLNSLDIYTKFQNNAGIANINLQLGVLSFDMQNYQDAVNYFLQTIQYDSVEHRLRGTTNYLLALSYSELGEFDLATEMFAIAQSEIGSDNIVFNLQIDAFIGKMLINKGEYDKAISHLLQTIEKYQNLTEESLFSPTYAFLSRAYLMSKDYRNAIRYGCKSYELGKGRGSYIIYLREAEESLYLAYKAIGNIDSAYFFLHEVSMIKDSISSISALQRVADMKGKFEFEQELSRRNAEQALKDAITEKELEKERLVRNLFIGGFILLTGFASLIYYQRFKVTKEKKRSDRLLLNILPAETAEELKTKGSAAAKQFNHVTVLFTDFINFTGISEALTPTELVAEINTYFTAFDDIIDKHGLEKIKTIGDAYMAVCGLPHESENHAERVAFAALDILEYVAGIKGKFQIRIGMNSGPVVAGIVGVKKFQYDIWGDAVNTASRMESNGAANQINVSEHTYALLKNHPAFQFEYRGSLPAKGKGDVDMYFVSRK